MARPNLLLIVIDSVRADHCSCYGHDRPTTPNLDRLAADGLRFDAAHSESSWTLPVCFTLLTGLAPREHQAEAVRTLPREMPSLAEVLQRQGYATFGASANSFFGPRCGLERGFDVFAQTAQAAFWTAALYRYGPQRIGWGDWGGRGLTRQFLRWLDGARRPWFALIWHNEPHHPYSARQPFTTRFLRRRMLLFRRVSLVCRMRRMLSLAPEATPDDLLDMVGLYDGCLAYSDWLVGLTREGLERRGQWEDTAVVVTADHGDMLGERGLLGHGRTADMYLPLLRIPLIVRLPGLEGNGRASEAMVQMADITRTLASLGGVPGQLSPSAAQTVDLREAAAGRGRSMAISERQPMGERSVLSARKKSPHFDFEPHQCHMTAVLQDGWRLIHRSDGRHELYRVAVDAAEKHNLAATEPGRLAELVQAVEDWQSRALPHPATRSLKTHEEAIVEKRLQDLGYF